MTNPRSPRRPEQRQILRILFTTILYSISATFSFSPPNWLQYYDDVIGAYEAVAFTAFLVLCVLSGVSVILYKTTCGC